LVIDAMRKTVSLSTAAWHVGCLRELGEHAIDVDEGGGQLRAAVWIAESCGGSRRHGLRPD
jgi:hypothetical protein